jgi:hypothetical protein
LRGIIAKASSQVGIRVPPNFASFHLPASSLSSSARVRSANYALAVGSSINLGIMHQDQLPVASDLYIELDHLNTDPNRLLERWNGVFRMGRTRPTMSTESHLGILTEFAKSSCGDERATPSLPLPGGEIGAARIASSDHWVVKALSFLNRNRQSHRTKLEL